MRKQIVLLAKKMTTCGLAAAMLFGVGPFDKVTTSKSAAADESYTYLYADLNWAEYWAAEDVYLKDGKNMTDSNETEDARGELDKGAFDAVSRATTNHGLHRGSFQCDAVITADNGQNYPVSYWEQDKDKNQSFYTTDGQKIGYAKGVLTLSDASTTKLVSYTVTGIKYVPVAVKTADLQDFKSKYKVVENGGKLVGGYSENALSSYEETASVTANTNGLKIAAKQADGSYTFGKRKTGTDSGVKDVSLAKASKTVASVVTDEKKKGSYGEFLRVDINSEDGAAANEGYGPLGSRMQAVKWTYYGTDSTRTKAITSYGTKFAADNWMHKSMGIQLGLTESYRSELPSGTDGTGYWNVTIYGLGYKDASYDVEVTKDGISENVTPSEAVDTSALQALVDSVKKMNAADYTTASWKEVEGELAEAEEELAKSAHYESMVNEAYTHLKAAVDALKKVKKTPSNTATPVPTATQVPTNSPDKKNDSVKKDTGKTDVSKLASVKIKKAVSKKKKTAQITWKKVSGATGYEVRYSLKKSMKKIENEIGKECTKSSNKEIKGRKGLLYSGTCRKNRIGQKDGWQMVRREEGKSKKIILKWMPGETTRV